MTQPASSAVQSPPTLPAPGSIVDGYVVEELIGKGGMAAVYSARGLIRGDRVALKMLLPQVATHLAVVHMLLDESRIIGRITHENVARVLHTGRWFGTPYLRLELVEGWSYARILKRARRVGMRLPSGFHAAVLAQVALGLSAAHAACDRDGQSLLVIHRDVKPENVLVGFDGRAKLVDFGIARARTRSSRTRPGGVKGTVGYMAPEQFVAPERVSFLADLWGLGATAWECFADRPLFRSRSLGEAMLAIVYAEIPDIGAVAGDLPEELGSIIMRCLEREPTRRPASALEVADAFAVEAFALGFGDPVQVARVLGQLRELWALYTSAASPSVPRVDARPRARGHGLGLTLGLGVFALAAALAVWLVQARVAPELPLAERGVASWRVERPREGRPVHDELIPTVDVLDLALER